MAKKIKWFENNLDFFLEEKRYLKKNYPGLHYKEADDILLLAGLINFRAEYQDILIEDSYQIRLIFPNHYPKELPTAYEIGKKIPETFHTNSDDKTLCLGANAELYKIFNQDRTIKNYLENILIPYLYTYSHFLKYGFLPYGELSHGGKGLIEYYRKMFNIIDPERILGILRYAVITKKYSGHCECPCQSGNKNRDCHGEILLELIKYPKKILKKDIEHIKSEQVHNQVIEMKRLMRLL